MQKKFNILYKFFNHFKKKIKVFNFKTGRWIKKHGSLAKKLRLSPKRRSKKRRTLKGGEIIGSGTSGTVISPALPCFAMEEDTKTLSSKIIFFGNAINETRDELLRRLRLVDPNQKMFIYSLGPCTQTVPIESLEEENKKDILELQSQGAVPLAVTNTGELSFFNMMKANKIDWSGTFQNVGIARVREMLDTIKEYLNVLHTQQIVHNDVQQDNIMLGLDRNVRLVDFGQSQMDIDNLTPEQLERAKRADLNRVEEVFREITLNVKKPRKRRFSEGGGGGGGGDEEESSLLSRSLFPPILERSSLDFNNKE